ncbi:MAG: hypothetical protein Q4C63_09380 [Eubacteriales bacterium]|nr:hypothetical protein [Eubacteriales bacterium]
MLVTVNFIITCLYYVIALFFLIAIIRVFVKSKNPQDAILYCLIMIPFVLRILRLK